MKLTITHMGETRTCEEKDWTAVADEMVRRLGPWTKDSKVTKEVSDFGRVIHDDGAEARIRETYDALKGAGVTGIAEQKTAMGYKPGDRMAQVGYDTQRERAIEHAGKRPARDIAEEFSNIILAEKRVEREVSAMEFAAGLAINGALTFNGLKVREQAVRGLLARLESPATRYFMGVRDRIAAKDATPAQKAMDRGILLDMLQRECKRFPDVKMMLRTREGLGDIFACVSPTYGVADAPQALRRTLRDLPPDARGSFSYDPISTRWELRAHIFTPTAVEEQAIGEPFEAYASTSGVDNGTGTVNNGGGITILQCLNASTYVIELARASHVHRGRILRNLSASAGMGHEAIRVLIKAWGLAREDKIERPADDSGALIPLDDVIPGFFRHMLTARKGELVGVLPGRTENRVDGLTAAYHAERRNKRETVRADFGQAFTKYIQTEPTIVRRDAEAAIARWTVKREKMQYVAA